MELEFMEKQLKAVADANRLRILACLKKGEVCVCDFTDVVKHFTACCQSAFKKIKRSRHYCGAENWDVEALPDCRKSNSVNAKHFASIDDGWRVAVKLTVMCGGSKN